MPAELADLRQYRISADYDCMVSIGLLMFFDYPTALRVLEALQRHVRSGGHAVADVLIEGTTYQDMFERHGALPVRAHRIAAALRGVGHRACR